MQVGDFNNDGREDLAVLNSSSRTIAVRLGDGAGGFSNGPGGSTFGTGASPGGLALADFDRDGNEDLATANFSSSNVTIRLGDGSGGFSTQASGSPVLVGGSPISLVVGFFNGDQNADLAVVNRGNANISQLFGNGSGGFTLGPSLGTGVSPAEAVVGDFNGDTKDDIAVTNTDSDSLTIALGNGTGGYAAAPGSPVNIGSKPSPIAVGDFNSDGNEDLAVGNMGTNTAGSNTLVVRLGNGTGEFATQAPGSPYPAITRPVSIAVGDFNSDEIQDLAVTNFDAQSVTVRLGNAAGGFAAEAPGSPFAAGENPADVGVGDFNFDGNQDLAVPNTSSNDLTLRLGGGTPADSGNLLSNGGAEAAPGTSAGRRFEAVPPVPAWTTTGGFTHHRYSIGGAAYPDRTLSARYGGQEAFFTSGLSTTSSTASQVVDVSSSSASIDAGLATARLSGRLGGFRNADDAIQVTATFAGADGAAIGAPIQIGPVTAAARHNRTTLLPRVTAAPVPAGTRSISVVLAASAGQDAFLDAAYADRIGLFLNAPAPPGGNPPPGGGSDTTPPQTTITKEPKAKSSKAKAKYRFTSSEPNSTFACKLDSAPFKPCDAGKRKYRHLDFGKHKFKVVATDAAGNADPTPAKDKFKRK